MKTPETRIPNQYYEEKMRDESLPPQLRVLHWYYRTMYGWKENRELRKIKIKSFQSVADYIGIEKSRFGRVLKQLENHGFFEIDFKKKVISMDKQYCIEIPMEKVAKNSNNSCHKEQQKVAKNSNKKLLKMQLKLLKMQLLSSGKLDTVSEEDLLMLSSNVNNLISDLIKKNEGDKMLNDELKPDQNLINEYNDKFDTLAKDSKTLEEFGKTKKAFLKYNYSNYVSLLQSYTVREIMDCMIEIDMNPKYHDTRGGMKLLGTYLLNKKKNKAVEKMEADKPETDQTLNKVHKLYVDIDWNIKEFNALKEKLTHDDLEIIKKKLIELAGNTKSNIILEKTNMELLEETVDIFNRNDKILKSKQYGLEELKTIHREFGIIDKGIKTALKLTREHKNV